MRQYKNNEKRMKKTINNGVVGGCGRNSSEKNEHKYEEEVDVVGEINNRSQLCRSRRRRRRRRRRRKRR